MQQDGRPLLVYVGVSGRIRRDGLASTFISSKPVMNVRTKEVKSVIIFIASKPAMNRKERTSGEGGHTYAEQLHEASEHGLIGEAGLMGGGQV